MINWIRKITRASMERANSDTGARQFVDSLLKYGLHILLFLAIINSLGVESASIAATVASAGAVSYTHLDVYKRQAVSDPYCKMASGPSGRRRAYHERKRTCRRDYRKSRKRLEK